MKQRIGIISVSLIAVLLTWTWFTLPRVSEEGLRRGRAAGADAQQRLELIWPDVRQMSEHDQRVLAYLAMRCRLDREPMVAQDVVRCLMRATTEAESPVHPAALARLLPPQYAISNETPL